MPFAFYNDTDEYCCEWLENLISARIIPYGVVDSTPIQRLKPEKLSKFTQVHLFAGMGGWPYALRLAQWPDSRPVWTGSCPCQPFSVAGKGKGTKDKRHLWPYMRRLINHASPKPPVVFGEQVSGAAGLLWLSRVRVDLEALAYEVGAVDSCAAGIGAPHIRQRLWWVAQSISRQRARVTDGKGSISNGATGGWQQNNSIVKSCGTDDGMGQPNSTGFSTWSKTTTTMGQRYPVESASGRLADDDDARLEIQSSPTGISQDTNGSDKREGITGSGRLDNPSNPRRNGPGFSQTPNPSRDQTGRSTPWDDYQLIPCLDGKHRRIKSGLLPLAHGIPSRVSKLRAIGNTIVPQLAAEFILAYLEINP